MITFDNCSGIVGFGKALKTNAFPESAETAAAQIDLEIAGESVWMDYLEGKTSRLSHARTGAAWLVEHLPSEKATQLLAWVEELLRRLR